MNKFKGNGLYILDEPEATLSPMRQMAMILQISNNGIEVIEYEKTEHYIIMKEFINNRNKMLEVLLE